MEKTYVDVLAENNSPLPNKEAYLTRLKKLDLNIPAKYVDLVLGLDQIAGAFYERRVPLNEIEGRAKTIVQTSVKNLESAFNDSQAQEAQEPSQRVPRYDANDPYSRTPEEAEAELSRLMAGEAYWNEDGKTPPAEHERLVSLGVRLREIIKGRETSLAGYIDGIRGAREERSNAVYGVREDKRSSAGLRSTGSEGMMAEGAD